MNLSPRAKEFIARQNQFPNIPTLSKDNIAKISAISSIISVPVSFIDCISLASGLSFLNPFDNTYFHDLRPLLSQSNADKELAAYFRKNSDGHWLYAFDTKTPESGMLHESGALAWGADLSSVFQSDLAIYIEQQCLISEFCQHGVIFDWRPLVAAESVASLEASLAAKAHPPATDEYSLMFESPELIAVGLDAKRIEEGDAIRLCIFAKNENRLMDAMSRLETIHDCFHKATWKDGIKAIL